MKPNSAGIPVGKAGKPVKTEWVPGINQSSAGNSAGSEARKVPGLDRCQQDTFLVMKKSAGHFCGHEKVSRTLPRL